MLAAVFFDSTKRMRRPFATSATGVYLIVAFLDYGEFFNDQEAIDRTLLRYMALESRYRRRNFGSGIAGALKEGQKRHRFVRTFIPDAEAPNAETGFFFMTLEVPNFKLEGGYDQYRNARHLMLEAYALSFLHRYRYLKRIIGIATEPLPKHGTDRRGSSEDLVIAKAPKWTEELLRDLRERQKVFDIMKDGRFREYAASGHEWPDVAIKRSAPTPMNRQERRALAAKKRKGRRKR